MAEEQIDRIVESLARIQVTLESLRVSLETLHEVRTDHEQRLRIMESFRNRLAPVLAVLTFTFGAVLSAILDRLL